MKNILFVICLLFMSFSSAHGIDLLELAIAEDVGRSAGQRAANRQIEEYKQENRAQLEKAAMWDEFEEYIQTHEGASQEELNLARQEIQERHEANMKATCQNSKQCTHGCGCEQHKGCTQNQCANSEDITPTQFFIIVTCIVIYLVFMMRPFGKRKDNHFPE